MFLAWKKSENESKNGSKITKKRFRATPHQRVEKNTLQTQKMNPKSWKTRGFFTFFWPGLAGEATNKSIPYCFLQCFVKASVTTYQKQEVFSKKCPPQVNLNLSWLMPSGWSRPLHLRCGRISLMFSVFVTQIWSAADVAFSLIRRWELWCWCLNTIHIKLGLDEFGRAFLPEALSIFQLCFRWNSLVLGRFGLCDTVLICSWVVIPSQLGPA